MWLLYLTVFFFCRQKRAPEFTGWREFRRVLCGFYRLWIAEKLRQSNFGFYLFCLLAQAGLTALVGAVVICYSRHEDRKSTRLNSSHLVISYAVFCLKKKKKILYYCQVVIVLSIVA